MSNPADNPNNAKTSAAKPSGGGSGIASKIKGAFQVAHGIGEGIRGAALGSVDSTMAHQDARDKNSAIASKGKAEYAEGMSRLRGTGAAHQPTTTGAAGATSDTSTTHPANASDNTKAPTSNNDPNVSSAAEDARSGPGYGHATGNVGAAGTRPAGAGALNARSDAAKSGVSAGPAPHPLPGKDTDVSAGGTSQPTDKPTGPTDTSIPDAATRAGRGTGSSPRPGRDTSGIRPDAGAGRVGGATGSAPQPTSDKDTGPRSNTATDAMARSTGPSDTSVHDTNVTDTGADARGTGTTPRPTSDTVGARTDADMGDAGNTTTSAPQPTSGKDTGPPPDTSAAAARSPGPSDINVRDTNSTNTDTGAGRGTDTDTGGVSSTTPCPTGDTSSPHADASMSGMGASPTPPPSSGKGTYPPPGAAADRAATSTGPSDTSIPDTNVTNTDVDANHDSGQLEGGETGTGPRPTGDASGANDSGPDPTLQSQPSNDTDARSGAQSAQSAGPTDTNIADTNVGARKDINTRGASGTSPGGPGSRSDVQPGSAVGATAGCEYTGESAHHKAGSGVGFDQQKRGEAAGAAGESPAERQEQSSRGRSAYTASHPDVGDEGMGTRPTQDPVMGTGAGVSRSGTQGDIGPSETDKGPIKEQSEQDARSRFTATPQAV